MNKEKKIELKEYKNLLLSSNELIFYLFRN